MWAGEGLQRSDIAGIVIRERLERNCGHIIRRCNVANRNWSHVNNSKFEDRLEKKSTVLSLILDMVNLNCPWNIPEGRCISESHAQKWGQIKSLRFGHVVRLEWDFSGRTLYIKRWLQIFRWLVSEKSWKKLEISYQKSRRRVRRG